MKTAFRKSFARDLKKIKDRDLLQRVQRVIENVEAADDLSSLGDIKKLGGTTNLYRIRVGEYRLGVAVDGQKMEFVRCLPRKELYRYFP